MWMVDPTIMCRQHLLGEHVEIHMLVGAIRVGKSLSGYISNNLCQVDMIKSRHEELVVEMIKRGYNHKSPLPNFQSRNEGKINSWESFKELLNRCPECAKRYDELATKVVEADE